ncbi:MAG: aminotransferase class I/II-fold pyridoxal phosphate-dependent enzyme [bacterium]|nr:aminotransferase class I/II-fold pyridoxal phosphate-dependent enzyme [bacterium]
MTDWRISLFEPDFNEDDERAVTRPLRDGWLTMGAAAREFEDAFAARLGAPRAAAVNSGTAALHLALMALEIGPGDEVIPPSLTFCACANVIRATGARPVFADIHSRDDWTMSPADLEAKITPRTRAVIVVHYAGFACRMEEIASIAKARGLAVIEDCAHALTTAYRGAALGTWGDVGCFSFFTNKNMTTGEGGMAAARDAALDERIRRLRSHGMTTLTLDRYQGRAISYDVTHAGLNYRIDEIRARLGLSQLARLDGFLARRREVYRQYRERLDGSAITIPFREHDIEQTGVHIFPIALPEATDRTAFIEALKSEGIQTSIHYPPIHRFSAYQEYAECGCPLTEEIAAREVTLPFYPAMTEEQVEIVCEAVLRLVR